MNCSADHYQEILAEIKKNYPAATLIAVSKRKAVDEILPVLDAGCLHFGENVLQEAMEKWPLLKARFPKVSLHFLGKCQSNKVKQIVQLCDYIHSVDREKIANKISECQQESGRRISLFIQVNIAGESQKNGIAPSELSDFYHYCQKDKSLNVIGLMAVPPKQQDSTTYFKALAQQASQLNLSQLSMGMSGDYLQALECGATFVRVGQTIFGHRT